LIPLMTCTSQSNHRQIHLHYIHLLTMSLSLLRTSLRSGQPSIARGFASSTIKFQQPLKTAHPADVVSGNVAGIPATQPEDTRALAAEVVSDAPSKYSLPITCRDQPGVMSDLISRGTPTPSSPNLPTHQINHAVRKG